MEQVLQSDLVQEELRCYGLSGREAALIRHKDGVIVAKVRTDGGTAILKAFENETFRREIRNYEILQRCGVPTIAVLGKSERSILLEDIDASGVYRLGEERDLHDPAAIEAIARWYRTLHTNGSRYVRQYGAGMYEEWDLLTAENLERIRERFDLAENKGLRAVREHFSELRALLDAAPRTLTYNDFYYTNLIVRRDASEALMFDYNLLGKGCCVSDIHNVIYWLDEENRKRFFAVYGDADARLMLLDRICAPAVSLVSAAERNIFPDWAREAVAELDAIPALLAALQ